jgi:hypothetical protein
MECLPLHEQDLMFSISAAPARLVEGFGFGRLDLRMEFGRSILKVVEFFFVVWPTTVWFLGQGSPASEVKSGICS